MLSDYSTIVALGAIAAMLSLLALGIPVAIALGVTGFVGLVLIGSWPLALAQMQSLPYSLTSDYAYAVIPCFVFMGNLAMNGGMARELYTAADKWLGHLTGGQYLTTIAGSAGFAAASGSTLANATVFTRLALPEMMRLGYSKGMASACIAASGTLAAMIPPSVAMVVYGIVTEQSIGKLMVAGIIPGIVSAVGYSVLVVGLVKLRPGLAPETAERQSWRARILGLRGTWAVALLFLVIMGGIYLGSFSPSAAGAVGAFGALVILLLRRRLTWSLLVDAFCRSAVTTAMLFVIIMGGLLFSRMLVMSGVITAGVEWVAEMQLSPLVLVIALSILYVLLGCLIDALSMLLVTLPFVFPLIQSAGIDPIWFGILAIQFLEIGAITPPVGLNLFATLSAAEGKVTMEAITRGILPFLLLNFVLLALFIAVPELVLWLPGQMSR